MKQAALVLRQRPRASQRRRRSRLTLGKGGSRAALLALIAAFGISAQQLAMPVAVAAEATALAACAERLGRLEVSQSSRDVVIVALDPELSCALRTALGPWGMRVVQARGASPGPSMPGTSLRARRVARDHAAAAVVWLSEDADGFALWVYDAESDRVLARPAPPPPFDPSVAAALALSIKALLRLTVVAAEAPSPPPSESKPADPPAVGSPESRHGSELQVALYAGARFGLQGFDQPEPRFGVELRRLVTSIRLPRLVDPSRLWLGLGAEGGAPYAVESAELDGRFWDPSLQVALGFSHAVTEQVSLGVSTGVAVHLAGLSGTAPETNTDVAVYEVNSALVLRPELQVGLGGPLDLLFRPGAALWVRRQRYTVNGTTLLETPRVTWQLAVGMMLH